jgi:hypothetical protein
MTRTFKARGIATAVVKKTKRNAGPIIGLLVEVDSEGQPLVDYLGNPWGLPTRARTVCGVAKHEEGAQVALLFDGGDLGKPLLIGVFKTKAVGAKPAVTAKPVAIEIDDQTFEFQGAKQIVLRCGEASITLTRAGKILIRGKYVLSDSAGVNMVKGGVIRLN